MVRHLKMHLTGEPGASERHRRVVVSRRRKQLSQGNVRAQILTPNLPDELYFYDVIILFRRSPVFVKLFEHIRL